MAWPLRARSGKPLSKLKKLIYLIYLLEAAHGLTYPRPLLILVPALQLRPVNKLDRSRHIFLQCGREKRKSPLFILDQCGSSPVALHLELRANGSIVNRASTGNEQWIDFDVTIAELNRIARAQPVAARRLDSRTVAPHPVTHQHLSIGVEVAIVVVSIDVAARAIRRNGIGQRRLDPQVEVRESRKMSEIKAGIEPRAPRRCKRRRIIRGNGIVIDGQPLPKQRHSVAEIESSISLAGVFIGRFDEVACGAEVS